MCFVNIFSQSVTCLFIFLIMSFEKQKFLFNLSIFKLIYAFLCPRQEWFVYPKVMNNFSYVFFQKFYKFSFYILIYDSFQDNLCVW